MNAPKKNAKLFIKKGSDQTDQHTLDQIKRSYGEQDESPDIGDGRIDSGSHIDNLFQGHHLRVKGQHDPGVQKYTGCHHDDGAYGHGQHGHFFCLVMMIDEPGGDDHGTADAEIGELADSAGAGPVDNQVEKHFDQFNDDAGHRRDHKGADQHGNLAEIQLIEAGGDKGNGKLKEHQHDGESAEHSHNHDVFG